MQIKIIPYTLIDGVPTYRDSEILDLYDRMVADKTVDAVFSDLQIQTSGEWLAAMKSNLNMLFVIYADDEISAILWLNRFEGRTARNHFCTFSNAWGKHTVGMARAAFDYVLHLKGPAGGYLFDVITGILPAANQLALGYITRVGVKYHGPVPNVCFSKRSGKSEPGYFTYITREILNENLQGDRDQSGDTRSSE